MTAIEALKKQPLFSWISNAPLEYLVEQSETRKFQDGEVLYEPDTPGDAIYLILEGVIEFKGSKNQTKLLNSGELFGECSVIELKDRPCKAHAKGETTLLILNHDALFLFSEKYPDPYSIFITNLARCLAARIRDLNKKKAITPTDEDSTEDVKP